YTHFRFPSSQAGPRELLALTGLRHVDEGSIGTSTHCLQPLSPRRMSEAGVIGSTEVGSGGEAASQTHLEHRHRRLLEQLLGALQSQIEIVAQRRLPDVQAKEARELTLRK